MVRIRTTRSGTGLKMRENKCSRDTYRETKGKLDRENETVRHAEKNLYDITKKKKKKNKRVRSLIFGIL